MAETIKTKLLLIEDDPKIVALLTKFLIVEGYDVMTAFDGQSGLEKALSSFPDVILLDIMLPKLDGMNVCKELRKTTTVPILMLTAKGSINDRIEGLDIGADDYLIKPFDPRELVARIETILRRTRTTPRQKTYQFDSLSIDIDKQVVSQFNIPLDFTTREFDLLYFFIKNKNVVVSRDQIMEALSGIDRDAFDRSIDVLISRFRKKIKAIPNRPIEVKTIWGSGYKLIVNV